MNSLIHKWFTLKYPQNYIIKNPAQGALIITVFIFGFITLYKPADFHPSRLMNYEATMAFYSFICGFSIFLLVKILKLFTFFSNTKDWIIIKEFLSVFLVLTGLGVVI